MIDAGCEQEFEPTFNKIAGEAIKVRTDGGTGVRLGRMDRWQNEVPAHLDKNFAMSGFPTMFLVLKDCRYCLSQAQWRVSGGACLVARVPAFLRYHYASVLRACSL